MMVDEQGDGVNGRRVDPKAEALAASRTLNPHPEAVTDQQFGSSAFFDARDLVQVKYEMVRQVRVQGTPVARAASAFGLSRPSYYQAAAALERAGLPGLVPAKPGPRGAHKLTDQVCQFAEQLLAADASLRPAGLVEPLAERFGLRVHPRSIERALARRRQQRQAEAQQSRKAGDAPKRKSSRSQPGQHRQRGRRGRGVG